MVLIYIDAATFAATVPAMAYTRMHEAAVNKIKVVE